MQAKIIFITGSDTGVGKTLVTSLLYLHLKARGHSVLAIKPFCCGERSDAELFYALQSTTPSARGRSAGDMKRTFSARTNFGGRRSRALPWGPGRTGHSMSDAFGVGADPALALEQINPFYFQEPVAPLVAARNRGMKINLEDVLTYVGGICNGMRDGKDGVRGRGHPRPFAPVLLIEGAGGLLAPLGPGYSAMEIIRRLKCQCIVISANRLGTLNHTLLTVRALQAAGIQDVRVVLSDLASRPCNDPSTQSNLAILQEMLGAITLQKGQREPTPTIARFHHSIIPLFQLPYLGRDAKAISVLKKNAKKFQKTLARILA